MYRLPPTRETNAASEWHSESLRETRCRSGRRSRAASAACGAAATFQIVTRHGSLAWLLVASAVGVGIATLALWTIDRAAGLGLFAGLRELRPMRG